MARKTTTTTASDGEVMLRKGHRTRPFPTEVADQARAYGWTDPDDADPDEPVEP